MVHKFSWAVWTFKSSQSNVPIFIFTGSYRKWYSYSWVHRIASFHIHGFMDFPKMKFMSSYIWQISNPWVHENTLYSYSWVHIYFAIHIHESRYVVKEISEKMGRLINWFISFTWICKNLIFIVMDMIFIFMSMIFIFMFMFMRFLFIFIFMTLIFIFKTIHEVQIHIPVIFMLMHIHIHGNSWSCTRNSHELYEPWTVMSCMTCNAWDKFVFRTFLKKIMWVSKKAVLFFFFSAAGKKN